MRSGGMTLVIWEKAGLIWAMAGVWAEAAVAAKQLKRASQKDGRRSFGPKGKVFVVMTVYQYALSELDFKQLLGQQEWETVGHDSPLPHK
jgi:hypothetical protein